MEVVVREQMQAFTAKVASMVSAKKQRRELVPTIQEALAMSRQVQGTPTKIRGNSGDSSEDEQVIRQGKVRRAKARVVR